MGAEELEVRVSGWPPAKSEARSLFAEAHGHGERVLELLRAARAAVADRPAVVFGSLPIGLDLTVWSPSEPLGDATNFLGGVADVLEVKDRRGSLAHLGELASVGLYENDKQILEVGYRWLRGVRVEYVVRLWALSR